MKRRIAHHAAVATAATVAAVVSAIASDVAHAALIDDYRLRVRSDMEHELTYLSDSEFAPPRPDSPRLLRELHRLAAEEIEEEDEDGEGQRDSGGDRNDRNDGDDGDRRRRRRRRGAMERRAAARCSSPLASWTAAQIRTMGHDAYRTLYESRIVHMPYVYKHYVDVYDGSNPESQIFVDEYRTRHLQRRHRDAISFWRSSDIDGDLMGYDNVLLLSMDGYVLGDDDKLVPTIMRMFDFESMDEILDFASEVRGIVESLPDGYANPLLTMNAIATRSNYQKGSYGGHDDAPSRHGGAGGGGRVKDSIMIGDGVLRFLDESGHLETGSLDFVHAHEFGHHVQFRLDHAYPPAGDHRGYDNGDDDDGDRREELMADAIGGYYLAHDEGGDATRREIDMFVDAAHATGDCEDGEDGGGGAVAAAAAGDGHHGTPDQRRCAAAWGARLATMAVPAAALLDPRSFAIEFDGAYGDILGLDAVACAASSSRGSTMAGGGGTTGSGGGEGWTTTTTAPDSADAATIDLQDWLDYMGRGEEDDHREGDDDDGGGGEWEHPPEGGGATTTFGDDIHGPSPPLPGDDGGGPTGSGDDDRVVVAGKGTSSSSSWGPSRGKPDAVHRGDDDDGAAGTVDAGDDDDAPAVVPYGNFADRGTSPEETYRAYANHHGLMVDDCDMPWVYCISSGAAALRRASILGMICTISSSVVYFVGG